MQAALATWGLTWVACAPSSADVRILDDPQHHWDGYVEMVPAVRLPQPSAGEPLVRVYVRLPDAAGPVLVDAPDGRRVLSWPPGTVADRVERRDGRVDDVRGMQIGADGTRYNHVFRASARGPDAPLIGVRWPVGDADAGDAAADDFIAALRQTPLVGDIPRPEAHLRSVRSKLDCDGCHAVLRPDNARPREHGVVARGTDAAGWFTPSTVLASTVPLERYGGWDGNLTDPHVRIVCADGAGHQDKGGHAVCADGSTPRATLDVAAARQAGSGHAARHCRSVVQLAKRLPAAQQAELASHPCLSAQTP